VLTKTGLNYNKLILTTNLLAYASAIQERSGQRHMPLSSLRTETRLRVGRSGSDSRQGFFSSPPRPDRLWQSIQSVHQWVPRDLLARVKRPEITADHTPPCSYEVKDGAVITPSPIRLHGVVLS